MTNQRGFGTEMLRKVACGLDRPPCRWSLRCPATQSSGRVGELKSTLKSERRQAIRQAGQWDRDAPTEIHSGGCGAVVDYRCRDVRCGLGKTAGIGGEPYVGGVPNGNRTLVHH